MIKVEDKDFQEGLVDKNYIVKFMAQWCGPCRAISPIMKELEEKTGITVFEVDTDDQDILASRYQIRSLPTVMFFKAGVEAPVETVIGMTSKQKFFDAAEKLTR